MIRRVANALRWPQDKNKTCASRVELPYDVETALATRIPTPGIADHCIRELWCPLLQPDDWKAPLLSLDRVTHLHLWTMRHGIDHCTLSHAPRLQSLQMVAATSATTVLLDRLPDTCTRLQFLRPHIDSTRMRLVQPAHPGLAVQMDLHSASDLEDRDIDCLATARSVMLVERRAIRRDHTWYPQLIRLYHRLLHRLPTAVSGVRILRQHPSSSSFLWTPLPPPALPRVHPLFESQFLVAILVEYLGTPAPAPSVALQHHTLDLSWRLAESWIASRAWTSMSLRGLSKLTLELGPGSCMTEFAFVHSLVDGLRAWFTARLAVGHAQLVVRVAPSSTHTPRRHEAWVAAVVASAASCALRATYPYAVHLTFGVRALTDRRRVLECLRLIRTAAEPSPEDEAEPTVQHRTRVKRDEQWFTRMSHAMTKVGQSGMPAAPILWFALGWARAWKPSRVRSTNRASVIHEETWSNALPLSSLAIDGMRQLCELSKPQHFLPQLFSGMREGTLAGDAYVWSSRHYPMVIAPLGTRHAIVSIAVVSAVLT